MNVYVADSSSIGMCQWSKFKAGFDKYTSHYEDEEKFINDILRICKKREIDYIFPSHNETEVISRHRHRFSDLQTALLPNAEHCALLNDKARSLELASSLNISVPEKIRYETPKDLREITDLPLDSEYVIKLRRGNSSKGVFYAKGGDAAGELVSGLISEYSLPVERYPIVEKRVPGEGWGVSVLYWKGKHVANFTHRRLREKISTGGTSTYRESAIYEKLVSEAIRLFDEIGWHGLAMMEFKVCPDTGNFWYIEVNPRMWGSISLAIHAGVEFPHLAVLCANEGVEVSQSEFENANKDCKLRARWVLGDLLLSVTNLLKLKPIVAYETLFSEKADITDDFFLDDPLPFLGEIFYYVSNAIKKFSLNPSEKGMVG